MIEHECKKMSSHQYIAVLISSSIFLYFVFTLIKFLYKVWWTPIRIKSLMASQGVEGPSYKFIYGNSNEIRSMRFKSIAKPMKHLSHDIFSYLQPDLHSWLEKYGMNFLTWHGTQPSMTVFQPNLIKEVLNDKQKCYPKTQVDTFGKRLVGEGLASSEGEKWVKKRKLANHHFHTESVKNMIPAMIASAEMTIERWGKHEGKEIEVYEEFRQFTSEVISRTAFGSSYAEGKNIFELMERLTVLVSENDLKVRLPFISNVVKSRDEREAEKLEVEIRQLILQILKTREKKVMKREIDNFGSDFLGSLVKAYHDDDESKSISLNDLIDECKTFYFAGQETTNSLLAWTILLLCLHTDWQDKARNEVLTIFGRLTPNYDDIAKLKLMSMILNETLRLYPPILGLKRKADREVQLGKLALPANIEVSLPILPLHHDTDIWGEDAHLFKPERFSDGIAKATNNNMAAYFPFGIGPRMCVGSNFALIEAKIALSLILQRYTFTLSTAYAHSPRNVVLVRPQHGVQVVIHSNKEK